MKSLLTCHGDYTPESETCKTCPMRPSCVSESDLFTVPDSVFIFIAQRCRALDRMERWKARSMRFVERYSRGVGVKRAITFGQLRRGLVLRKRREERDCR